MRDQAHDSVADPSTTSEIQPPGQLQKAGEFFHRIPLEVANDLTLSDAAYRIYGALRFIAGARGICSPSRAFLGSTTGKSWRTIARRLRELVEHGHIKLTPLSGAENIYRLLREPVFASSSLPVQDKSGMGVMPKVARPHANFVPASLQQRFSEKEQRSAAAAAASSSEDKNGTTAAAASPSLPRRPESPKTNGGLGVSAPFDPGTPLDPQTPNQEEYQMKLEILIRKWPKATDDLYHRWPTIDRAWLGRLLMLVERTCHYVSDADLVTAIDQATDKKQFSAGLYERTLPAILQNWKSQGLLDRCTECFIRFAHTPGQIIAGDQLVPCPTCTARLSSNNSEVQSGKDRSES